MAGRLFQPCAHLCLPLLRRCRSLCRGGETRENLDQENKGGCRDPDLRLQLRETQRKSGKSTGCSPEERGASDSERKTIGSCAMSSNPAVHWNRGVRPHIPMINTERASVFHQKMKITLVFCTTLIKQSYKRGFTWNKNECKGESWQR